MSNPSQRLESLIGKLNLNTRSFAIELGYSRADSIYAIFKRNSKISNTLLNKISNRFPQVNKDWLLTGHGTMFNTTTASSDDLTVTAKQVLDKLEPILKEDFEKLANQINQIHEKIYSIEFLNTLDYINTKKKKNNI
jgi:hypothetical protein